MPAKGPRPWPIRIYVGVMLLRGLLAYADRLAHLDRPWTVLGQAFDPARDRDWMIVAASAQLTIVAIPLAMIWFAASRIARWLVTFGTLAGLPLLLPWLWQGLAGGGSATAPGFALLALHALLPYALLALLWTPAARRWFRKDKPDAVVFH